MRVIDEIVFLSTYVDFVGQEVVVTKLARQISPLSAVASTRMTGSGSTNVGRPALSVRRTFRWRNVPSVRRRSSRLSVQ